MEQHNWARVQMDHEEARQLIRRAEWALSIVSAVTLLFSALVSLILPRQVTEPLVNLKEAMDHAAKGTYDTLPIIRTFPRESRLSVLVIRSKVNHSLFLGPSIGTVDCISF